MNISGDLSISEFKPRQHNEPTSLPSLAGPIGKNSFLDLMKSLQGSAQKGLDATLAGIQNTFSKTETSETMEENEEVVDEKKTESTKSKEEVGTETEGPAQEGEELEVVEEATNVNALPWFLVAEAKPNETVDPEIESAILDELQTEIIEEVSIETQESKPAPTNELIESFFSREEKPELLNEVVLEKESEIFLEEKENPFLVLEGSKDLKRQVSKKEETIREEESKLSPSDTESASRPNESNSKESKENGKGFPHKETSLKGVDETKTEVSKELALDSEKWKISRDKKTDSYINLKSSAREEIKTAVLNQFSENSSGKSGQEQSFRSGGGDSYSSLVKGVGAPLSPGKESHTLGKDFSISKESNVLSKRDIQQNFQNLIRSARVSILENGKTEANIRMNPKDLGQMSLSISTDKDIVRGKLLVESDSVKQQLVAELASLKQDLKANGLELESLVIEVKEKGEAFAFNAESDKNGKDSHSFQSEFGEEWNNDFKNSSYEEDELSFEENSSESHGFAEKTDGKTEKLLDLKV
ncbi:flagellar hook-length control protein FliK [Leptospira alstonii]|uniref:Flagellar hook-length control protein FliK n=2 Tax=Leptospira alstonii TaxID=28452 RepID=M6D3D7_9LEPT|nr:flagellar hook-length control protein FliK [Leptospira alstonii]EMJ95738.1 flagellar hook-length control protein FliK [Leptospira alstonii serovar Sichuan str. 79601]EQA80699.1 flagellar hook-length control protein FliK [Leptospira alstonii serovar Pingchang str. 80-412]